MKKILNPSLDVVLKAARECHRTLEAERIYHVIIGGLAVYLHGDVHRRPRDVDLLVCGKDDGMIGTVLTSAQYGWDGFRKAYLNPNGVRVEPHWDGKGKMRLPDPEAIQVNEINSLPVIALNSLIEMKLECDLSGHGKKTNDTKHRKDVLALIHVKKLKESYAEELRISVRDLFRALACQANRK
ncbi:hypothetical protein LCGC14_3146220 [marine sediment metagenome]|uniref:Uncharacterized protein n=1 Tax=marine sediment metagenome TaxID=412755 RepID=A0A0F8VVF3_9ZZZZ